MNPVRADLDGHQPCDRTALPGAVSDPVAASRRLAGIAPGRRLALTTGIVPVAAGRGPVTAPVMPRYNLTRQAASETKTGADARATRDCRAAGSASKLAYPDTSEPGTGPPAVSSIAATTTGRKCSSCLGRKRHGGSTSSQV